MGKKPSNAQPVTGRTNADVISEALQLLGKLGVPAIIVGALLFAFFMFSQMIADAQLRADKQNQEKLDKAQQALIETYSSIGDLSKQQISNVKELLSLNEQVAKTTEEGRLKLEGLRARADEHESAAEKARLEADRFGEQAAAAQAKLDALNEDTALRKRQAERELKNLLNAKGKLQLEYDALQEETEKKKEVLASRAKKIEELRAQLDILARQVTEHPNIEVLEAEPARLAQEFLEQEASRAPRNLLLAFASKPGVDTFEALEALDGVRDDELLLLLQEGMGFVYWNRIINSVDSNVEAYVGSVGRSDKKYLDNIYIEMDEGRVFDVDGAKEITAFKVRDVEDWYRTIGYLYVMGLDYDVSVNEQIDNFIFNAEKNTWTFSDLFIAKKPEVKSKLIYGNEEVHRFENLENFETSYPDLYTDLQDDQEFQRRKTLADRMLRRAQEFDAEKLPGINQVQFPKFLRQEFTAFLNAAVNRDSAAENYIAVSGSVGKEDLGVIAAHVLGEGLSVNAISPFLSETRSQVIQSAMDGSVWVVASGLSGLEGGAQKKLSFRFVPDGADGWLLSDFSVDLALELGVGSVEDKYWVVVGSFRDKREAQVFTDRANKESSELGAYVGIFNTATGYWPVIAGYGTRNEALKIIEKVLKLESVTEAFLSPA